MDDKIIIVITIILVAIIYLILYPVTILLNYIEEKKQPYKDGYFSDMYENLNKAPIKNIALINNQISCQNLFTKKEPIYFWKGKCFFIERINSSYLELLTKGNNSYEIGTDSLGNKLYFDKKVINFLEITKSSEPSIDKDLY